MKYLVHQWGVERFRNVVQERAGFPLAPPRRLEITDHRDHLDWHPQGDGKWHLGLMSCDDCIADDEVRGLKTAVRQILAFAKGRLHLTPHHHLLLCDLSPGNRPAVERILADCGVDPSPPGSPLRGTPCHARRSPTARPRSPRAAEPCQGWWRNWTRR